MWLCAHCILFTTTGVHWVWWTGHCLSPLFSKVLIVWGLNLQTVNEDCFPEGWLAL